MKLYDFAFSPNCRKVRAVGSELGAQLEIVTIDLVKGELVRGVDHFMLREVYPLFGAPARLD